MKKVSKSCAMLALFTLVFSCSSAPPPETVVSQALSAPRKLLPLVTLTDGRVLAAGGHDGHRTLSSCEVYDPAVGEWHATGAMRTPRRNHAAVTLVDGGEKDRARPYLERFAQTAPRAAYARELDEVRRLLRTGT